MKGRIINTADLHNVVTQRKKEYGKLAGVINGIIEEMVAATPTTDRTVQDFTDKCRECGKTAITRAENDEILNEAWHLLANATEEDGVPTEQANGMIKLLAFFLYKYHGQKKPEWVESVEARLAGGTKPTEGLKMHPIKDGFPKTNSVRYLVQDINGRIWDAEYDECQDKPEERFGEWAPEFKGGGYFDAEWRPYPEIVAWAELPKLYEDESEADKMKIPYLMHKEMDIPISECKKAYDVAIDYLRSQGKVRG